MSLSTGLIAESESRPHDSYDSDECSSEISSVASESEYETFDWYNDDPHFYDVVFRGDIQEEQRFLLTMRQRYCMSWNGYVDETLNVRQPSEGRTSSSSSTDRCVWYEPACGTCRVLLPMAEKLVNDVFIGYDISVASLERAKRQWRARQSTRSHCSSGDVPCDQDWLGRTCEPIICNSGSWSFCDSNVALFQGDMRCFETRPNSVDVAFNLVCSFKHLLQQEAAEQHLASVHSSLKPGGIYILGIHLIDEDDEPELGEVFDRERWTECHDGLHVDAKIFTRRGCQHNDTEPGQPMEPERTESVAAFLKCSFEANTAPEISTQTVSLDGGAPLTPESENQSQDNVGTVVRRLKVCFFMRTYTTQQLVELVLCKDKGYDFELVTYYDFDLNTCSEPVEPLEQSHCLSPIIILRKR